MRAAAALLQLAPAAHERVILRLLFAELRRWHQVGDVVVDQTKARSPPELRFIADRIHAQSRREIRMAAGLAVIRPPEREGGVHHPNADAQLPLRCVFGIIRVVERQEPNAAQLLEELIHTIERSARPATVYAHRVGRDPNAQRFLAQCATVQGLT